jgi:hypothetical protein
MGTSIEPDGIRILASQAEATILTELLCLLLNAENYCATGYVAGAFEFLVRGVEFCAGKEAVVYGDSPCNESCVVSERLILSKVFGSRMILEDLTLRNTKLVQLVRSKHSFTLCPPQN